MVENHCPNFQLEYREIKQRDFSLSQLDLNWCYQRSINHSKCNKHTPNISVVYFKKQIQNIRFSPYPL